MNHGQALIDHNRAAWDRQASEAREWSRPVESSTIAAARAGRWQVHLTPRALPLDWMGDVRGRRILCLASGLPMTVSMWCSTRSRTSTSLTCARYGLNAAACWRAMAC